MAPIAVGEGNGFLTCQASHADGTAVNISDCDWAFTIASGLALLADDLLSSGGALRPCEVRMVSAPFRACAIATREAKKASASPTPMSTIRPSRADQYDLFFAEFFNFVFSFRAFGLDREGIQTSGLVSIYLLGL